jgi:hypothetical protein
MDMAIRNRWLQPGLVSHADHGVQFTSWALTQRARASGLVPSMGSIGDCYDCEHPGIAAASTDRATPSPPHPIHAS